MNSVTKTIRYSNLLSIYGNQLSSTQKSILSDYYDCNLSISEIASNREVSRAAIEDAVKKGTNKLDELENDLRFLSKKDAVLDIIKQAKENKLSKEEALKQIEKEIK